MWVSDGQMSRPDTVYRSSGPGFGAILMCAFFSVCCAEALTEGPIGLIGGVLGLLIFVPITLGSAWESIRRKPLLVISDRGIWHRTSGEVRWDAIDHVRVRRDLPSGIELDLVPLDRDPAFAQAAARSIPLSELQLSTEAVLYAMRRHWPSMVAYEVGGYSESDDDTDDEHWCELC
ncbi:hypothetical protein [Nocardia sp. NPDC058705]|uniref:hypothetical protein n=1 Tax=Nocardia sp. NPDC058705 TaxID=3346609 RepID=UPI0036B2FD15